METNIIILFFVISAIHIFADYKFPNAVYFTKPLPLLFIIFYCLLSKDLFQSNKLFIFLGFIFTLAGDLLLINKKYFYFGLISFLITHLFFITYLLLQFHPHFNIIIFFIIVFAFIMFYRQIITRVQSKKSYLNLYGIILFILLWQSLEQLNYYKNSSSLIFAIGIILFAISDILIAFNKFIAKFHSAQFLILSTYFLAQFLILISTFE